VELTLEPPPFRLPGGDQTPRRLLEFALAQDERASQVLALSVLDAAVPIAFATIASAMPRPWLVAALALSVSGAWIAAPLVGAAGVSQDVVDAVGLLHRAPLAALVALYPQGSRRVPVILLVAGVLAAALPGTSAAWSTTGLLAVGGLVALDRAARGASVLRAPRIVAVLAGMVAATGAALTASAAVPPAAAPAVYDGLLLAAGLLLAIPAATRQWSGEAVTHVALDLGEAPAGAPVTARLAGLLGDGSLQIYMQPPGADEWVDESGRPVVLPEAVPGSRTQTALTLDDGARVVLAHDALAVSDELGRAAAAIAATTIANAASDRALRARIDELERVRGGLVRAIDDERRELQNDLQSGPLRELELARQALLAVREAEVGEVLEELDAARVELRGVADGVYPSVVLRDGLESAIRAAAGRIGVATSVGVTGDVSGVADLPEPVAIAAYFLATESLTNVAKHAHASSATVELILADDRVWVRVADDGRGGTDPDSSGLLGMRDRAQALGGDLRIESRVGEGTRVEAWLPRDRSL
jgi:signal transduction histidine kinase